ncbi:MAG: cation transporting ATPase C-terminal domain-containing protein [Planctomycetaceae bacterium]|nr:cation transporting ATPase C-terminal domain-containing protein [Planctomycetaceae bacterium]
MPSHLWAAEAMQLFWHYEANSSPDTPLSPGPADFKQSAADNPPGVNAMDVAVHHGKTFLSTADESQILERVGFALGRVEKRIQNARGPTFAALVAANIGLVLTNRSWSRTIPAMMKEPNKALWWVIDGTALFLALVIYLPVLRAPFHFAPLHTLDVVMCLFAGAVSVLWFEALKIIRRISRPTPASATAGDALVKGAGR